MNRRDFVKSGAVAATAATLAPAHALEPSTPGRKPNILYVFDDQHRFVSLPGEPFAAVTAPNIDKFRRENFSMDSCISNYPLCCPYRAVLMTGRYPQENGVLSNMIAMRLSEFTLSKCFKAAGYRVGYVGKWHLAGDHDDGFKFIPAGPGRVEIDDWHIWEDTNNHYACYTYDPDTGKKIVADKWAPINMTDQAIGLMKGYAQHPDQPWMLTVSYNPPHPPFNPPDEERNLNPVNAQKYRPNMQIPGDAPFLKSQEAMHKAMQGYIGGITGIDIEFGRILKALDELKLSDNTIVIFTSDHGEMMGSHGRHGKVVPYEESNHVPFLVRYPGVTSRGGSSKQLFAAIDIYPTLCGLAGIPVPPSCSGHDLSDLIRGKQVESPKMVFILAGAGEGGKKSAKKGGKKGGEDDDDAGGGPYRGVRTDQYTYAVNEDGRWMLHDNHADPYQLKNLAGDPAHKELMASFDIEIKKWMTKTRDGFHFPASLAVTTNDDAGV